MTVDTMLRVKVTFDHLTDDEDVEALINDLESLELLESGYYFDVDLRDISSEHMFKNYFNLIVKHERCVT